MHSVSQSRPNAFPVSRRQTDYAIAEKWLHTHVAHDWQKHTAETIGGPAKYNVYTQGPSSIHVHVCLESQLFGDSLIGVYPCRSVMANYNHVGLQIGHHMNSLILCLAVHSIGLVWSMYSSRMLKKQTQNDLKDVCIEGTYTVLYAILI